MTCLDSTTKHFTFLQSILVVCVFIGKYSQMERDVFVNNDRVGVNPSCVLISLSEWDRVGSERGGLQSAVQTRVKDNCFHSVCSA